MCVTGKVGSKVGSKPTDFTKLPIKRTKETPEMAISDGEDTQKQKCGTSAGSRSVDDLHR